MWGHQCTAHWTKVCHSHCRRIICEQERPDHVSYAGVSLGLLCLKTHMGLVALHIQ